MAQGMPELEFPTTDPVKLAEYWKAELTASDKWLEKFIERSRRIEDRYLDERENVSRDTSATSVLNLFWSNVEVMIAALYARPPKVDVSRTFKDPDDDVARVASNILERVIMNDVLSESENETGSLKDAILDRLVVGLGQLWQRYEVDTAKQTQPATVDPATGIEVAPAKEIEVITDERSPIDFVRWEDFRCSPIRRWRDCRWVGRRVYMNKQQAVARFGQVITDQMNFESKSMPSTYAHGSMNSADNPLKLSVMEQSEVWEIWDKLTENAYWFNVGAPTILDFKKAPLKLPDFFPCPAPLLASTTTKSLIPKCEYYLAQDQYEELDMVTSRIHLLTEAIRVVGVYDKNNEALKMVLSNKIMNEVIPVNNWAMFAEKGGLKGALDWFPLEMVITTLEKLTARKAEIIQEIYQILGISDIMRGMSNPNESATAQNLKSQFGGARIGRLQSSIGQFVQSAMKLKSAVIRGYYQDKTLMMKSQIASSVDAKFAQPALQLLKDPSSAFKIKVQSDSMASPEWLSEKQQRTEAIQGVSQFIGMTMPLIQQKPEAAPYLIKMLQWAVAGFKGGEELESVLDEAFTAMSQPKPPKQPSPMEIAELERTKAEGLEKGTKAEKNVAEAGAIRMETKLMPASVVIDARKGANETKVRPN